MIRVSEPSKKPKNKVTVVGTGMVGMACATSLLSQVHDITNAYFYKTMFYLLKALSAFLLLKTMPDRF